jgi:hypothetical protein
MASPLGIHVADGITVNTLLQAIVTAIALHTVLSTPSVQLSVVMLKLLKV